MGTTAHETQPMHTVVQQLPGHVYNKLPTATSTRIVCLHPRKEPDESRSYPSLSNVNVDVPHVSLEVTDLQDKYQNYVALSYTWGTQDLTHPVLCDGEIVLVTSNLHSALRRLRLPDQALRIWCDALSINQSRDAAGLQERAQQVQMMHQVFAKAQRVIVDLGEYLENFEVLQNACSLLDTYPEADWRNLLRATDGQQLPPGLKTLCFDGKAWTALARFMTHAYWARIWTLQENVVAQELWILVGLSFWSSHLFDRPLDRFLELKERLKSIPFERSIRIAMQDAIFDRVAYQGTMALRKSYLANNREGKSIFTLLWTYYRYRYAASDPRDMLYALYGLVRWKTPSDKMPVDYNASADAVSRQISWLVATHHQVDLLLDFGVHLDHETLPSWCLSLEDIRKAYLRPLGLVATAIHFDAGKNVMLRTDSIAEYRKTDCISITGCIWDDVCETTDAWPLPLGLQTPFLADEYSRILHHWNTNVSTWSLQFLQDHLSSDQIFELRWRTLLMDMDMDHPQGPRRASPELGQWLRDREEILRELVESMETGSKIQHTPSILDRPDRATLRLANAQGRRFGGTGRKRHLALLPEETYVGDEICIFAGVNVPFVLRSQPGSDPPQRKLVGPCYVHGIMDGEATTDPSWRLEHILIC